MGASRRETTFAIHGEYDDLKQIVALLGQAGALSAGITGISPMQGGTSPTPLTQPGTFNYGSSTTSYSNVAAGGNVNPSAIHGVNNAGLPNQPANVFGPPSTGTPLNPMGAGSVSVPVMTVTAVSMTVNAQTVVINGQVGGGGGAGTGATTGFGGAAPPFDPNARMMFPAGGGNFPPGGGYQSLQQTIQFPAIPPNQQPPPPPPNIPKQPNMADMLMTGLKGFGVYEAASYLSNVASAASEYAFSGRERPRDLGLNILRSTPIIGGLLAGPLEAPYRRADTREDITELRGLTGVRNAGDQSDFYTGNRLQGLTGSRTIREERGQDTIDLLSHLAQRGMTADTYTLDLIDRLPPGSPLRRLAGAAIGRAADISGGGGAYGGEISGRGAADLLLSTGDYQGAIDTGRLRPSEVNLALKSRRAEAYSGFYEGAFESQANVQRTLSGIQLQRGQYGRASQAMEKALDPERADVAAQVKNITHYAELRTQALMSGNSDAIANAERRYEEQVNKLFQMEQQLESTEIQTAELAFTGAELRTGARTAQAGISISAYGRTGRLFDNRSNDLFRIQTRGANENVERLKNEAAYNRANFGSDSQRYFDSLTKLRQAESDQQALPFEQISERYQQYGQVASAVGGQARGAAQIIIIQGRGSSAALGDLLGGVAAAQVNQALVQGKLAEDTRMGAGPGIIAQDRLAVTQSGIDVAQQQLGLADYKPPAEFDITMRHAGNKLRRMQESFLEPGDMLSEYQTLMRGAQAKIRALDAHYKAIPDSIRNGPTGDAIKNLYDQQREDAIMEEFEARRGMETGWIDRLTAESINAPSFAGRIKPTMEQAARALENGQTQDGFRQARNFGFVSSRGFQYEKNRGNITSGVGPLANAPGDIALRALYLHKGGKAPGGNAPSDSDFNAMLGLSGDTGGGASESTQLQILSALLELVGAWKGKSGGAIGLPGATPNGYIGATKSLQDASVGPFPGDTNTGGLSINTR